MISDTAHAWNAVYLNGRWIEVDASASAKYYVKTKSFSSFKAYDKSAVSSYRKCDFDATKASNYYSHYTNLNDINRWLCTDKTHVR